MPLRGAKVDSQLGHGTTQQRQETQHMSFIQPKDAMGTVLIFTVIKSMSISS